MKVVLLVILVLVLAAGVAFWLSGKHTPAPLPALVSAAQTGTSASSAPESENTNAVTPVMASSETNSSSNATNSASVTSSPGTNAPPSADISASTNTPGATNATPTDATAPPVIVFHDKFTRDGELNNSEPDPTNVGQNSWTVTSGDGTYSVKDGKVSASNGAYDAVFLPVNGNSGVTLDGKQNFTLAATITPDATNHWMGLAMNKNVIIPGHNIFDFGRAEITVAATYADAYDGGTSLVHVANNAGAGKPVPVSLTYHARSGNITFTLGDKVISTLAVTADDITALAAVSFGNGAAGPTATISDFSLTVGGAD